MTLPALDEDAVVACVDLVGRTGARNFEIGYLHDDVPVDEAAWYAHAQLKGARITEEDHRGPTEAADALSRRLLEGGKCTSCGGLITLSSAGAKFHGTEDSPAQMADGTSWTADEARAAGQCRWRRLGPRWSPGCGAPDPRALERLREQGVDISVEDLRRIEERRHDEETVRWTIAAEDAIARLQTNGWVRRQRTGDGIGTWDHPKRGYRILHSIAREQDGEVWAHVSMSRRDRKLPTWEQMRDAFWLVYPDVVGVIVVAPQSGHINLGEVMHVWACLTKPAVPDFSEGMGTI